MNSFFFFTRIPVSQSLLYFGHQVPSSILVYLFSVLLIVFSNRLNFDTFRLESSPIPKSLILVYPEELSLSVRP